MMGRSFACAALAALVAACGSQGARVGDEPTPQPAQRADDGPIIGEVRDPRTRAKAHTDLAAAYYEVGNIGVALEEAQIALRADPTYAPAYNVLGLVQMDLKDVAAADASFQRGLRIAPQDPDLNHNYGWFLCQSGREDQSIQWFMNAIRNPLYPTPARSYSAAGRCLLKRNPTEAANYLERALRLDPNNVQAILPYADLLYKRGQLPEAKELVVRFNRLVPEPTAESLWLGIRIERRLGDRQAEASLAAQLRRRYAGSPEFERMQRGEYD
jgi:type IV pilus assembly protein PilF